MEAKHDCCILIGRLLKIPEKGSMVDKLNMLVLRESQHVTGTQIFKFRKMNDPTSEFKLALVFSHSQQQGLVWVLPSK